MTNVEMAMGRRTKDNGWLVPAALLAEDEGETVGELFFLLVGSMLPLLTGAATGGTVRGVISQGSR